MHIEWTRLYLSYPKMALLLLVLYLHATKKYWHIYVYRHGHTNLTIRCISDVGWSLSFDSSHFEEWGCFCPVSGLLAAGSKVGEYTSHSPTIIWACSVGKGSIASSADGTCSMVAQHTSHPNNRSHHNQSLCMIVLQVIVARPNWVHSMHLMHHKLAKDSLMKFVPPQSIKRSYTYDC